MRFVTPCFLQSIKKAPQSVDYEAFILRSGRDSNPRPPA